MKKAHNYLSAYDRLAWAVAELARDPLDELRRDGLIQRFAFTFELAWKSLKEYLEAQGFARLTTPREVLREAYAAELIDGEAVWLSMLDARNQASHLYDEDVSAEIAARICGEYLAPLGALAALYRARGADN